MGTEIGNFCTTLTEAAVTFFLPSPNPRLFIQTSILSQKCKNIVFKYTSVRKLCPLLRTVKFAVLEELEWSEYSLAIYANCLLLCSIEKLLYISREFILS